MGVLGPVREEEDAQHTLTEQHFPSRERERERGGGGKGRGLEYPKDREF